jgi:hypothetical protein
MTDISIKEKYSPGERFHSFVILSKTIARKTETGREYSRWECQCDCGKLFLITAKQIHRGQKSCGCQALGGRFTRGETIDVIGQHKYGLYTYKAKNRDLPWELSKEEFLQLIFADCYYCGSLPLTVVKINCHEAKVNGVDRVNNDLGYIKGNCVACCKICNRAKSDATLQEFLDWIKRLRIKK